MSKSRTINLTKEMLHTICNALNSEAAVVEDQAKNGNWPEATRAVMLEAAMENRFLVRVLYKQWEGN